MYQLRETVCEFMYLNVCEFMYLNVFGILAGRCGSVVVRDRD